MMEQYIVTIDRPDGVSKTRMRDYIREAVRCWSGQFEPPHEENDYTGDPLFGKTVCAVRRIL